MEKSKNTEKNKAGRKEVEKRFFERCKKAGRMSVKKKQKNAT